MLEEYVGVVRHLMWIKKCTKNYLYDHLTSTRIFTLIKIFVRAPKTNDLGAPFRFAHHIAIIACFICYEKWVQSEQYSINTRLP